MNNNIKFLLLVLIFLISYSCKHKTTSSFKKIPIATITLPAIQKLIVGKTWQVIDAASITGSRVSAFAKPETNNDIVIAPNVIKLNWLSEMKGLDNATDFALKFYKESFEKYKTISLQFKNDSIVTTTGLHNTNQLYTINNTPADNEANGNKLKLTYNGTSFANVSKMTTIYYIYGINEKYLYLLTPNTLNDEKVVFLLEAKSQYHKNPII